MFLLTRRNGTQINKVAKQIQSAFGYCTSGENVIFEEKSNSGIITLNRAKALNALSADMSNKIHSKLKQWDGEKDLVIIKGAGDGIFCCGGDVREIMANNSIVTMQNAFRVNAVIGQYRAPYIALIDGITMGAGVGISINGKYRIATEKTVFAMPENAIGLFPDATGSYHLPRLKGKLGLYLGLTGHRLQGQDVTKAGIATHFVRSDRLYDLETALINTDGTESALQEVLTQFNTLDSESFILDRFMDILNECCSAKTIEEVIARFEAYKEKEDDYDFSRGALWSLSKMCPTSLKITMKQMELGAQQDLIECIRMEYRIARRLYEYGDFREGVRAKLVEKDHKPQWKPKTLAEVSDAYVDGFFEKLPDDQEMTF